MAKSSRWTRFLVLFSSILLAACTTGTAPLQSAASSGGAVPSHSAGSSAGTASAAVEPVVLRVSTWTAAEPGFTDLWPEMIKAFEEAHPGVTVEIVNVPFASYLQDMTTRFVADAAPDIIHIPLPIQTLPAWAKAGFLRPIDDLLAVTDIPSKWSALQSSMSFSGKSYGVLLSAYGFMLFYNDALLKRAGVKVPTTSDELVAAAKRLTTGDEFGFAVTADNSPNFTRDVLQFLTGLQSPWVKDGSWNFNDPAVINAVETWRTLATKYAPQGTDITQKRQLFYDGKVAMMFEGPQILAAARKNAPEALKSELHAAQIPFPTAPGDASNGFALPVGLDPKHEELAWDFILRAASLEMQQAYATHITSPVMRPEGNDVLRGDSDRDQIVAASKKAVLLVPSEYENLRARWSDFATIASDAFHTLLAKDADTANVMRALEDRLNAEGIRP